MTLMPADIILTGTGAGVGPVTADDTIVVTASKSDGSTVDRVEFGVEKDPEISTDR